MCRVTSSSQSRILSSPCKILILVVISCVLVAVAQCGLRVKLPSVSIDGLSTNSRITVSGISSGAVMAVQLHYAYSSSIKGAGVVAGVPYFCAQDNVAIALGPCMKYPLLISTLELETITRNTANFGFIDDPSLFLKNARVLVYSGTKDAVVATGSVQKTADMYKHYNTDAKNNIVEVYDVPSAHAWVNDLYGNKCDFQGSPYINNCGVDIPGRILQHVLSDSNNDQPPLKERVKMIASNLFEFDQKQYVPFTFFTLEELGILEYGYVYIPSQCQSGTGSVTNCAVHIALHGCLMSAETIGDTFARESGLNEWAEANNIIVLYPQSRSNLLNPNGCWDWWGYSGMQYASNLGYQMMLIKNIMSAATNK